MQQITKQNDTAHQYLIDLLTQTDDKTSLTAILDVLMTDKERQELINRLKIFALLQKGHTQREISAQLGVGLATVSRGAKVMQQYDISALMPELKNRPIA